MSKKWTQNDLAFLTEHYAKKGSVWCAQELNRSESAVRNKAYEQKIAGSRDSEARKNADKEHSKRLTGRSRPEHSQKMKAHAKSGRILQVRESPEQISERMVNWHSSNPHPRGMLGKKHTKESKNKMADALVGRKSRNRFGRNFSRGSWKAGWREIGGKRKYYRSRWEANYARFLEYLKSEGEIAEWAHECEVFWFEGIRRGQVSYLPDFKVIYPDRSVEFHEVKGWMDAASKTKIKRMAIYHPNIVLKVIDSLAYLRLERSIGRQIDGWEFKHSAVR